MSNKSKQELSAPWAIEIKTLLDIFSVDPDLGLTKKQVQEQRNQHGRNRLRTKSRKSTLVILGEQFQNIIIWLLIVSAVLSFIFGEWVDGSAVVVVILLNTLIGFFTELRAVRSMEALREMTQVDARVLREGEPQQIPADKLVPGDIVLLDSGDIITADLRLIEASKIQANESTLTGESEAVSKQTDPIEEQTPLADRRNMLFKGTSLTRGSGVGVVVFTGRETELGQISELVAEAQQEHTPLEKRLDQLGGKLVWVTLGIIAIVVVTGILRGREWLLMIETAVALAVAAIPEGLPIVATIALARGMRQMAANHALINQLASVETLGGTNVICTDKTGTLTENQMTVVKYVLKSREIAVSGEGLDIQGKFLENGEALEIEQDPVLKRAVQVGMLCSNAQVKTIKNHQADVVGEPVEEALILAGLKAGYRREELHEDQPEVREVAFDPEIKMMATFHNKESGCLVAVKGAPEQVLSSATRVMAGEGQLEEIDSADREQWLEINKDLASEGLRLLGLAYKETDSCEDQPYQDLILLGLVALLDPPREEVKSAIQDCQAAGIQVTMVTGDQAITALNIARSVGLTDQDSEVVRGEELKPSEELNERDLQRFTAARIFARVSPRQKLDLISIHQQNGSIVAMTGDGVNDAPALKKADIGIAMGKRGTQVARQAADMVLEDDALSTIVLAVRQGRVIFNNIRRFVIYLISCNVSEILVVFLATMLNLPLPIRPLQILFLNLVTDVFPALALGVSEGDPAVMKHQPRDPKEPILMNSHWLKIGGYSSLITLSVLSAYGIASKLLQLKPAQAVTVSFLTLAFAQLWHVLNMRDRGSHLLKNDVFQNPYIWGAIGLCTLLLLGAIFLPPLARVLELKRIGGWAWALVLGLSLVPLVIGQIFKGFGSKS